MAVYIFYNWFEQLHFNKRISSKEFEEITKVKDKQEIKSMLVKRIQKEKERLFRDGERTGEKRGEKRGKVKGRLEGKIEDAKIMLKEGLDLDFIKRVTGLTDKDLAEIRK